MEVFGYVAIFLAGLSLGLIGGGGSILTVPILVYFFGVNPVLATGHSLLIVGATAAVGSLMYARQQLLRVMTGLIFGLPSLIGVSLARAYFVPVLPDPVFEIGNQAISKDAFLMISFSILMVTAAIAMLRSKKENSPGNQSTDGTYNLILVGFLGFGVGCITGFLGAGGGFLIVPILALILKLSMKSAVGTSLFIISISSLVGFTVDVLHHESVQFGFLGLISLISVMGMGIGIGLANFVSNRYLKKGFGLLVLAMGIIIFCEQMISLS